MKKDSLIKLHTTLEQKNKRVAWSKERRMLLTSEPKNHDPSHDALLQDMCMRDRARVELVNLEESISKIPQSPRDVQMVLRRLARIE